MSKERKNCLCTAMIFDPAKKKTENAPLEEFTKHSKLYERFMSLKKFILLKGKTIKAALFIW
jgi:hypothetical protein